MRAKMDRKTPAAWEKKLVSAVRFELTTNGLKGRCSTELSYALMELWNGLAIGAPRPDAIFRAIQNPTS